ncbi:MAG: TonB-dependent receptor [Gammaproteobacteria bacterium]
MRNHKTPARFRLKAASVLLAAAISSQVFADTGGLRVVVTDASGNPVVGAMVQASTPESLTSRSGVTGPDGEIRLLGLDPSAAYEVVVSGSGYQPLRNSNVTVVSGRNFTLSYEIERSSTIEEVVVVGRSGRTQLVDTTSALVGTDITLDLTESLPTGRDYQSYLQLAPSTKPTLDGNPSSKSGVNYSDAVDSNGNTAGTSTDNVYYIDGVNITDNLTGGFGANFNSEIIQEQQIITGGVPAEYEGGQGLISRVVTKSGSNEFHGSLNYYMQSDSLVSDSENLPDSTFSTFDTAFTLGGPIIQDKLWFFTSYQRKERDEDIIDPVTNTFQRAVNETQDLGFFKLTWAATDNDKFTAEFFNDPYERDGSDDYTVLANRDSARVQGGDNFKYSYSHTWDNLIVTLDYAKHEGENSVTAADSSSRNDVAFNGIAVTNADTDRGGRGSDTIDFRNKDTKSITVEYFLDTAFGYHEIKAGYTQTTNERFYDLQYTGDGAQYTSIGTQNSGTQLKDYTSGTWTGERDLSEDDYQRIIDGMTATGNNAYFLGLLDSDSSGSISPAELESLSFNATAGNPDNQVNVYRINQTQKAPVTFTTEGDAYFLQDSWNINENWTINAGVRAERWDHIATDGSRVFTFDWEVAPRLSLVYDIFGDGGSKVWAFAGRYYDPIRTDMTQFAGTLSGSVREEQVYVGNQWVTFRTRGGAQVQDGYFAPTTKTPFTDEKMIGFEHTLSNEMSIQITYTDRETKDILEDYDLGFYTDPAAVGGYALPLSYFGFDTLPSANYFIATLEGGVREYEGVEVTFRKRRSADDRWQMLASYSYNDASGNSNSDGNADLQGDFLYLDPRAPNVYGPQPGNIEHLLKLAGSYSFDNGIELGAVYAWNSGLTYSETFSQYGRHTPVRVGDAYDSLGATTRWLAPGTVGSHTSDSYGTLDLRAKYTMDIGGFETEFFLDIFNALDDQAVTREQELAGGDGVFAFGEGSSWVLPRRFYLGTRIQF